MRNETSRKLLVGIAGCVLLLAAFFALGAEPAKAKDDKAPLVTGIVVTGHGTFEHGADLIVDGKVLPLESEWQSDGCVYWEGTDTYFVLDLGEEMLVEDLVLQVDNNDSYRVDASADNVKYSPLLTVEDSYGEVGGGMDTFRTRQGDPKYLKELDFKPVQARYLKVYAAEGDNMYAISEVKVFASKLPKAEKPKADKKP